jgi:2,4-dienoyl-CoA reductase (NADPH2)
MIEMLDDIGKNFGKTTRWGMLQDVERFGVKTKTAARALEITAGKVRIENAEGVEEIPADTVVLAVGTRACNPLQEIVAKKGIPFQVAGDAVAAAMVFDAIHQGFAAGAEIG